ncbi:MAG: cell envelope integrity protein TolA [Desulfomonile sp.]|nr:cell envelope integrity protein TolA [Desulfomonile sp.]
MTAVSAALHALFLLAIVVWGFAPQTTRKPQLEFTKVTLVEAKSGPPALEALEPPPAGRDLPSSRIDVAEVRPEQAPSSIEMIQPAAPAKEISENIPVKKRKRPLQRLPEPESKSVKKPKEEPPRKQESPDEYLKKRLAALEKDVASRKKTFSSPASQGKAEVSPKQGGGGASGADIDPELVRWMRQVRSKVNAVWAVIGQGPSRKVTVIGVQISDDGALTDATVDETSGDAAFDRSALRAVHQAAPFPPLPTSVKERIRQQGGLALRFTPGDVQ